jgi:hypothetical protein
VTTDQEWDVDDISPDSDGERVEHKNVTSLLDAPDYSSFVRIPKTGKARDYEKKVASMAKAGMTYSIGTGNLPDAATFIHYGPAFAAAAGDYAAKDERAAKMIDMVCSPASPALTFILAGLPLLAQLARNHGQEISAIPEVRRTRKLRKAQRKAEAKTDDSPSLQFRIPVIGKTVSLRMKMRMKLLSNLLGGFQKTTTDPEALTVKVFSDEKLQAALRKQGIDIRVTNA